MVNKPKPGMEKIPPMPENNTWHKSPPIDMGLLICNYKDSTTTTSINTTDVVEVVLSTDVTIDHVEPQLTH